MSKDTWEFQVENVFLDLFRAHKMFKGKRFYHHDEAGEAASNCIVVKATQGAKQLEGPKAFEGEVECEWRSTTATPEQSNLASQGMLDALSGGAPTPSMSLFSYFRIEDEKTNGDRSNTKNLRKRMRTFPVVALLR